MQGDANEIRAGLRDVIDFEIGLDVVAMGMIREIEMAEEAVTITMILTSPMCPMASFMMNQVKERAVGDHRQAGDCGDGQGALEA